MEFRACTCQASPPPLSCALALSSALLTSIHSTLSSRVTHLALTFINMGRQGEQEHGTQRTTFNSLVALWVMRLHNRCFYLMSHLTPHSALRIYFLALFPLLYVLRACMCAPFVCSVCECFARVSVEARRDVLSDSLGLELQANVSLLAGAKNRTWGLSERPVLLTAYPSLEPPHLSFLMDLRALMTGRREIGHTCLRSCLPWRSTIL